MLAQLDEVPRMLERMHEARTIAEQLNDDGKRGRVYAFMKVIHLIVGELDAALMAGSRALEIAERSGT